MRMTTKTITCTVCPLGCDMTVSGDCAAVTSIEGAGCKRGETYGAGEFLAPARILTTSVRVTGASCPLAPVRSRGPIPKEQLFDCMELLRSVQLRAPAALHDVVVPNILGTGVDVITSAAVQLETCSFDER